MALSFDGGNVAGQRRLLGMVGSLRRDSFNRKLLNEAVALLPEGAELEVWDQLKLVPPFDEDDEDDPASTVLSMREAIANADALLIVTPEYNDSLPGQLKNAIDWASRPRRTTVLGDKPVAVIGASPSPGGAAAAHADGRRVLAGAGARVLDAELSIPSAFAQFDNGGHLVQEAHREVLRHIVRTLLEVSSRPDLAAPLAA